MAESKLERDIMDLKKEIDVIMDFPKEGISFKDITTLLRNKDSFKEAVRALAEPLRDEKIDFIVAPEARGFVLGCPVAYELGIGFVPIRKKGKLPRETISVSYDKEYGTDELFMHKDDLKPGDRVAIIDDLLAIGGTIKATEELIKKTGATIVKIGFLIELTDLNGREKLDTDVFSIVKYNL